VTINTTTSFTAFEYHKDTHFYPADYRYEGSAESGWNIYRNNKPYLTLPRGYLLLKTLCCGICSTDIDRHNLPFPLPQIIGHEVVAAHNNFMVVVDINAAHKHLGDTDDCTYCSSGLENHCPDRLTLGIDRLPGGFAPYILVPVNSVIPLPDGFDVKLASIIEPFAAALHAVEAESIQAGDNVAIVGPRRLGSLLILALTLWRKKNDIKFNVIALTRGKHVYELCELAGADKIIDITAAQLPRCDVVFDTSGSTSGFELALSAATRVVHVKTTNGQAICGLTCLTEMVISELSLYPINRSEYSIAEQYLSQIQSPRVLLDSGVEDSIVTFLHARFPDLVTEIYNEENVDRGKAELNSYFDVAIGASVNFVNKVVKDKFDKSLIKPKGVFFLITDSLSESSLKVALNKGVNINTSRCGNFSKAIELLEGNILAARPFLNYFISGMYPINDLPDAFEKAKSKRRAIKLLVEHL